MPGPPSQAQSPVQNVRITDFTSGIVSQDYSPFKEQHSTFLTIQQPVPSASKVTTSGNSYGVIGLGNGGLLLGPVIYQTISLGAALSNNNCVVSGIITKQSSNPPVTYFTQSYFTNGGGAQSSNISICTLGATSYSTNGTFTGNAGGPGLTPSPTFLFSSIFSTGSLYYDAIVVSPMFKSTGSTFSSGLGVIIIGNGTTATAATGSRIGIAAPFGGRIWFFEGNTTGQWNYLNNQEFVNISYNDPITAVGASNQTIGTQYTIIDYELPNSFGAMGQIVSGEVLLVKQTGGGVIVSGDIFSPNAMKVPAVQPTGGLVGTSPITPLGLIYRSLFNGVWAWSGGAAATKLSAQISDAVWRENGFLSGTGAIQELNALQQPYGVAYYNMQQIGNFILTDSSMFLDMNTQAWWRLPPYNPLPYATAPPIPTVQWSPTFFAPVSGTNYEFVSIYVAASSGSTTADSVWQTEYMMDPGQVAVGATIQQPPLGFFHSFWESNPIQLSDDNIVEIQEVVIVVQGYGTLAVNCLGIDGALLSTNAISVTNLSFGKVRFTTDFQTDVITLQVGWTNPSSAYVVNVTPMIESISISYRERFPVKVGN